MSRLSRYTELQAESSAAKNPDLPRVMWQRIESTRWIAVGGLILMFLTLWFSFLVNGFGVAPWREWSIWERASEAMVLERIEADLLGGTETPLGLAQYGGADSVFSRLLDGSVTSPPSPSPALFIPYESEIGGQARLLSFAWTRLGCSSESCLHALTSGLFAATCIALFLGLGLVGSQGLAWAWFATTLMSPWMTFIARNLFWSPWTYLLPALAAVVLVVAKNQRWRVAAMFGVFSAFLFKYWATGYHEITVFIMLAACMPLLSIAFRSAQMGSVRTQLKNALIVVALGLLAFVTAILVHAHLLAGDIPRGLQRIWFGIVLRQTYGRAEDFGPVNGAGLDANPLFVLWRYVWTDWWTNISTDLLAFSVDKSGSLLSFRLGPASFLTFSLLCLLIVALRRICRDPRWMRDLILLVAGFGTAAVWFLAAKGYAFKHPFILFFNWYFLYIPVLVFVTAAFAWDSRGLVRRLLMTSRQPFVRSKRDHSIQN